MICPVAIFIPKLFLYLKGSNGDYQLMGLNLVEVDLKQTIIIYSKRKQSSVGAFNWLMNLFKCGVHSHSIVASGNEWVMIIGVVKGSGFRMRRRPQARRAVNPDLVPCTGFTVLDPDLKY